MCGVSLQTEAIAIQVGVAVAAELVAEITDRGVRDGSAIRADVIPRAALVVTELVARMISAAALIFEVAFALTEARGKEAIAGAPRRTLIGREHLERAALDDAVTVSRVDRT